MKTKIKKQKKVEALKFKNYHIERLLAFLTSVSKTNAEGEAIERPLLLHGSKARARNKIVDLLVAEQKKIEEDRLALVKKYGVKNKDGELKRTEDNKGFVLKKDKVEKFNEEFDKLMDENCIFDLLPSNSDYWQTMKLFVLNDMKSELDYKDTKIYDEVCVILEEI